MIREKKKANALESYKTVVRISFWSVEPARAMILGCTFGFRRSGATL